MGLVKMVNSITRKQLNKYMDNYESIFLKLGEIVITDKPVLIRTVLGSCLSVIFYNKKTKLSGICHAQLPERYDGNSDCFDNCPVNCKTKVADSCDFKYVTCSIQYMIDEFSKRAIPKDKIDIKIFGGASVIPNIKNNQTIGESNFNTAIKLLNENKMNVKQKVVGGKQGMNLYFLPETGDVYLSRQK
ncbi:chemotaxis protein CheD [Spirochaetota bacterium]